MIEFIEFCRAPFDLLDGELTLEGGSFSDNESLRMCGMTFSHLLTDSFIYIASFMVNYSTPKMNYSVTVVKSVAAAGMKGVNNRIPTFTPT